MSFEKLIRKCGLKIVGRHAVSEDKVIFEADHYVKSQQVSKYFLFPMSAEDLNSIAENEQAYTSFETNVIESLFLDVEGDLSWNIYCVFFIDKDDYSQIIEDRRAMIETSKQFARKLIVNRLDFLKYIPIGKISKNNADVLIADPLEEWIEILQPGKLEFCLERFANKSVTAYLEGESVEASISKTILINEEQITNPIESRVSITKMSLGLSYRSHCFSNAEFNFGNVNLFEGPNGCGKTSVLEAVEKAFTGDIQRESMGASEVVTPSQWYGEICLSNGQAWVGPPDQGERKLREVRYYQNRQKRSDQLNTAFHQYNYFSSEEVYKFCFQQQPDYSAVFSRVIFGSEINSIQIEWTRYHGEFASRLEKIDADIESQKSRIGILKKIINDKVESRLPSIAEPINSALKDMGFVDYLSTEKSANYSVDYWVDWSKNVYTRLKETEYNTSFIVDMKKEGIFSVPELNEQIRTKKQIQDSRKADHEQLKKEIKFTEDTFRQKTAERSALNNRIDALEKQIKDINIILQQLDDLQSLYLQEEKVIERHSLDILINHLNIKVKMISEFNNRWGNIDFKIVSNHTKEFLTQKLNSIAESIQSVTKKQIDIRRKIDDFKSRKALLETIRSEICSLGRKYIQQDRDASQCPLCFAQYKSAEYLKERLFLSMSNHDETLLALMKQLNQLEDELTHLKATQKQVNAELELEVLVNDGLNFLENNKKILGITLPSELSFVDTEELFFSMTIMLNEVGLENKKANERAKVLDLQGFSIPRIRKYDELCDRVLSLLSEKVEFLETRKKITNRLNAQGEEKNDLEKSLRENENLLCDYKSIVETYYEKATKLDTEIQRYENELRRLSDWKTRIEKIMTKITGDSFESIAQWFDHFNQLINEVKSFMEATEEANLVSKYQAEIKILNEGIAYSAQKRDRCFRAILSLKSLKEISSYSEDFLEKNIETISELFLTFHSPREFERLEIIGKEIVAYRRNSKTACSIYQMSTGQRTAVVLAVFFAMHLSMDTAPNFLLLDEPVANMDDLNVLGLMDFLRQLTINRKTQIFFTTANTIVASLFRRKFSFLGSKFQAFRFRRRGEQKTKIMAYMYSPRLENELKVTVVS